jgi:membrane fusion protein (multidrug efflux system)
VPGKYSGAVKANMKISFSVQGDEKKYFAKVIATEEGIDMNTRNFKARAIVEANSPSLVPGAFSTVELKVRENPQALVVPTQAIIPQELVKRVIVCKNKKAVFVPVKTGVRQSSNIEVLSGLNAGDTVVTTGILFIKPGAVLKFSKVNN